MREDDRLTLASFLTLARFTTTEKERDRFFELAEMYSRLERTEAADSSVAWLRRAA